MKKPPQRSTISPETSPANPLGQAAVTLVSGGVGMMLLDCPEDE